MAINVNDIRNIAVCGHGSAGKTTLVDTMLVKSGAVKGKPSVDDGTSICDFDDEEKHHKHSIEATVVHFDHAGRHFNVIDTPGYPDLIGQTISALRGVDTALIVIDAHSGIKVNTRRAWEEAGKAGLARILCITKLDDHNIDFPGLIESIKETFGEGCVLFNVPDGVGDELKDVVDALGPEKGESSVVDLHEMHERAVESIIEVDDEVMEKYFEGVEPDHDKLAHLTVEAMKQGHSPRSSASASSRMSASMNCSPSWPRRRSVPTTCPARPRRTATAITLKADPAAPLAAQVFRTRIDPFVQKLTFIRVFSGTLKRDTIARLGRRPQGRQDRRPVARAGGRDRADRRGGPGRHRGGRQVRGPAHRHVAGRVRAAADQVPQADGRPGRLAQEPRRRGEALRRACTRWSKRIRRSTSSTTWKPTRWCSPA